MCLPCHDGQLINDTYLACKRELEKPKEEMENCVRAVYAPFTVDEINQKIVEMLRPADMKAPIELVFQSIEGLHEACPNHPGDWYFTGHYPTPGLSHARRREIGESGVCELY